MTCEYCPWFEINFCKYHDKRMKADAPICEMMYNQVEVSPSLDDLEYLYEQSTYEVY
jgi:hypothetical protein